jgi:Tfp pilus assembly protein PilZ
VTKGRYSGHERRRSPRYKKRFRIELEYEGKTYEIRTIDISEHGVLIPRRLPPPIGTHIKLTLSLRDETSIFEGVVIRHTMCLVNGAETVGIGIDFSSHEYQEFVKDKIILA